MAGTCGKRALNGDMPLYCPLQRAGLEKRIFLWTIGQLRVMGKHKPSLLQLTSVQAQNISTKVVIPIWKYSTGIKGRNTHNAY